MTLVLGIALLSSCQRDNLDEAIAGIDPNVDDNQFELVDVTGQLEINNNGIVSKFYAYITSCTVEDFYLHTLVFADDFRFENNLVVPSGTRSQLYWTSFDSLQAGTFQAYSGFMGSTGNESKEHFVIEISQIEGVGVVDSEQTKFTGIFYPNPVYNPLTSFNTSYEFSDLSKVACEFDDIEPSILVLPDGEMTDWAIGRSQFFVDGDTIMYSSVMQYCDTEETSIEPLEAFLHIGHGVTNYNEGPISLAIGGEFLIYFRVTEIPKANDVIEASLFPVNEELFLNYNSNYLQENGIAIDLNVSLSDEERFVANFSVNEDSSGSSDFSNIMVTINTRIQTCN